MFQLFFKQKDFLMVGSKEFVLYFLLNQMCSSFEESKSFVFDGRLDVFDVAEVL